MAFDFNTPWVLYGTVVMGSVMLGAFICGAIYLFFNWINNKRLKKKSTQVLEDHNSTLDPGKASALDYKEVQEDERRKFAKFREFERLRRIAEKGSAAPRPAGFYESIFRESERSGVENKSVEFDKDSDADTRSSRRDTRNSIDFD